jgi:hypothetical protein
MPSPANLTAAYNEFLFATVGEDRNDMPLSVVSALARLDLDPWLEAAELARMPAHGAAQRLSALLESVSYGRSVEAGQDGLAAKLVSLLPSPASTSGQALVHGADGATPHIFRSVWIMQLLILASMAISLVVGREAPGAHGTPSAPERAAATAKP